MTQIEATIKGGLRVLVEGLVIRDRYGATIHDLTVRWKSGQEISSKVLKRVSKEEWCEIEEALVAA